MRLEKRLQMPKMPSKVLIHLLYDHFGFFCYCNRVLCPFFVTTPNDSVQNHLGALLFSCRSKVEPLKFSAKMQFSNIFIRLI